jgi:hypothetical protein
MTTERNALQQYRLIKSELTAKLGEFMKLAENLSTNFSLNEDMQEGALVLQAIEKADDTIEVPEFVQVTLADTEGGWSDYSATVRRGGPRTVETTLCFFIDSETVRQSRESAKAFAKVVEEIRGVQNKAQLERKWGV